MIRRTSPLVLRAIGSNSTTLTRTISASQQCKYSHSSVASAEDSVDATLYKALKHEIQSIKYNICHVKKAPDSFPFKIEVQRRNRSIKLGRELPDGEEITIEIDMNAVKMKESAIPMTVKLYTHGRDVVYIKSENKLGKDGVYIKFEITLSKEDITVERFTVFNKNKYYGISGPKFKEMDAMLQQWLRKYLEIRGIKTNISSYLLEYIAMENQKIDLSVLNILKNYILY